MTSASVPDAVQFRFSSPFVISFRYFDGASLFPISSEILLVDDGFPSSSPAASAMGRSQGIPMTNVTSLRQIEGK